MYHWDALQGALCACASSAVCDKQAVHYLRKNTSFPPFYYGSGKVLPKYILGLAVQIFIKFYSLPIVDVKSLWVIDTAVSSLYTEYYAIQYLLFCFETVPWGKEPD